MKWLHPQQYDLASTAVGLGTGGWGTLGLGALETGIGVAGLLANDKPYPLPTVSPGLTNAYNRSLSMVGKGYTPEQEAAFGQKLAGNRSATFRNATDQSGGQLAGAINRGLSGQNAGAIQNFAASGAALADAHTHYSDQLASQIQHQQNLITQSQQQHYNALQGAYGGALKSGLGQAGSAFNFNGMLNLYKQLYGNKGGGSGYDFGSSYNPNIDPSNPQIQGGVV